jgi:hypothetical protein
MINLTRPTDIIFQGAIQKTISFDIIEAQTKKTELYAKRAENRAKSAENKVDYAETQAQKAEICAKQAENRAKSAENKADRAETQAQKAELEAKVYTHKASVEADKAKSYGQKAKTTFGMQIKYNTALAAAEDQEIKFTEKKTEVQAKAHPYQTLARIKKAEAKKAEAENKITEAKKARAEAAEATAKVRKIEAEANEMETEARRAKSEAKKAELELAEAIAAIELERKHAESVAYAEAQAIVKKTEAQDRKAEAKTRRAEASAGRAEAKAIRAGNTAKAEASRFEARIHRAEAVAQQYAIKEKQNKAKRRPKDISQASEFSLNLFPNRQARPVAKKHLSATGLINTIREIFQAIPDPQQSSRESESKITLCDCLTAGFALFSLKYSSLLQFNQDSQEGGCIKNNLHTLYKINRIPSDTYMRERLDLINPDHLRPVFTKLFANLQRGKELEEYTFLDEYYLISGDGTGYFSSKSVHCKNCCTKQHKDGSTTYYHQMMSAAIVHPDRATVIPFCPEPIIHTDGTTKNDCERNASERLYRHIRREHPHLPIIVTEDALGSNGPHIKLLKELDMRFILVVKPDGNKYIFEFLNGVKRQEYLYTDGEFSYKLQFVNDIPLNDSHSDLNVNFLEVWVQDKSGTVYHNTWVTDIPITMNNVYRLYQGGRAKWKIENETFNTLKNQGYHFEHNYGHGNKHLSTVFALLMFLAFFIDQIQQSCCGLFQAALVKMKSKIRLWGRMRAYFTTLFIESWEKLWQGLTFGLQGGHLIPLVPPDTS